MGLVGATTGQLVQQWTQGKGFVGHDELRMVRTEGRHIQMPARTRQVT